METTDKKQDFINKYEKLVKETGFSLAAMPMFTLRDDGTFSTVIRYDIVENKVEEKKEG